jgi:hypothetical protein
MGFKNALQPLRKRRWLLIGLISIVSFFLLIVLLDNVIMPLYVKRGAKAVVPMVVGAKTDTAVGGVKIAGDVSVENAVRFDD